MSQPLAVAVLHSVSAVNSFACYVLGFLALSRICSLLRVILSVFGAGKRWAKYVSKNPLNRRRDREERLARREAAKGRDAPWPCLQPNVERFALLHAHSRPGDRLIKKAAKK